MFNIDKSHCVTTEQKLLWNIMKLLEPKLLESKIENNKICKYCGGTHSNQGEFLACARKNNKKGSANNA